MKRKQNKKSETKKRLEKYAHIAFEPDFVLKISDKKHYMIQGIPYYLKQQLVNSDVTISGDLVKHNTTIAVKTIKMKNCTHESL